MESGGKRLGIERRVAGRFEALEFNGFCISGQSVAVARAESQPLRFFGQASDCRELCFKLNAVVPRLKRRPCESDEDADDPKRNHDFKQRVALGVGPESLGFSRRFDQ